MWPSFGANAYRFPAFQKPTPADSRNQPESTAAGTFVLTSAPTHLHGRLEVLDGWRALSILMVLAGHLLPLNFVPNGNGTVAATGMALFFTLSGFLITRFLLERPEVKPFLIRRLLRILPLAWVAMLVIYILDGPERSTQALVYNLLFVANLPPQHLLGGGGHLWSLCVEMQFYIGVALMVLLGGQRALLALPVLCVAVTLLRISDGHPIDIVTWYRLDEILAGATLALIYSGSFGVRVQTLFASLNFYVAAAVAAACCYFIETPLAYLRPYGVAAMVGVTLWHVPTWLGVLLRSRAAAYIATTSYAVYVIHGALMHSWLGTGDLLVKYAKRPLLIGLTFGLAHLSTFYFEKHFIALSRRWTRRAVPLRPADPDSQPL